MNETRLRRNLPLEAVPSPQWSDQGLEDQNYDLGSDGIEEDVLLSKLLFIFCQGLETVHYLVR